ncbi:MULTISPECIES: AAA family ATPase [Cytobacillus]|uniref:AAA+ ATPase domain-containing protein n=4 Tax=Bacillati TaxID=1783272 RepID=A0A2N0Z976_9BACI|nr:AAA family ATPase [Cytobacillus horneckiae]MEC1157775.1 AAA family ATPase [Cytobacillus horneckiae]PKG26065.1 hypothetical protein CWS20_25835 [Cytobacillus horneckiae]
MQSQNKYESEPFEEKSREEGYISELENQPVYLMSATWIDRLVHVPFIWLGENPFVLIALTLSIILSLFLPIPFYILVVGLSLLGWIAQKVLPFESAIPPYLLSYNHAAKYGHEELWELSENGLDEARDSLQAELDKRDRDIEEYQTKQNQSPSQSYVTEELNSSNGIGNVVDMVSNIGDTVGSISDRFDALGAVMEGDIGAISDLFAKGEKEEESAAGYQQAQGYENSAEPSTFRPAPLTREERQSIYTESMKELHSMIGLEEVKQEVKNIILEIKANRKLEREGISPDKNTMHMIFSGPPGTGKTETARLIAKILQATGYLETGQLIEAQRGDLVAEYQGQTAKKVMDKFEEAKGGVLFIDEAYALKNGENDQFGQEAIDTIIKCMEDYRKEMVVILAGYDAEMNKLMKANPGFTSRIAYKFRFVDYTPEQLSKLAMLYIGKRGYEGSHLQSLIEKAISSKVKNGAIDGNGRWVRNFVDKVEKHHKIMIANNQIADVRKIHSTTIELAIKEMRD